MPDFNVLSVNHTSFTVSDLDRSLAFFSEVLKFELTPKAPRNPKAIEAVTGVVGSEIMVAMARGPGHNIELVQFFAPEERGHVQHRICDVASSHVAFDVDDIDGVIAASEPHGVRPIGTVVSIDQGPNKGGRAVFMRNPDGIILEFIQKPKV